MGAGSADQIQGQLQGKLSLDQREKETQPTGNTQDRARGRSCVYRMMPTLPLWGTRLCQQAPILPSRSHFQDPGSLEARSPAERG